MFWKLYSLAILRNTVELHLAVVFLCPFVVIDSADLAII